MARSVRRPRNILLRQRDSMGLGPYPCHHHHCHHHCHYADSRSTGAAAGIILPLPSSVAILVAGLHLYCVCPLMGYLDLGLSVSGLGGKPLAIHVTHTKAITAVKPLIGSLSHADCGEWLAGRPS
jgi:hypothetical protein